MRLILFDFDGVICDSFEVVIELLNKLSSQFGYAPLDENKKEQYREISSEAFFHGLGLSRIRLFFLIKKLRKLLQSKINSLNVFPGMPDVLKNLKLKDVQLGIVTSNAHQNVVQFLEHNQINLFDLNYYGIGLWGKDRIFNKIKHKTKLNPSEIYYVGDETRDIRAGKKAHIQTIAVTWGFQNETILSACAPTELFNTPEELEHYFT